MKGCKNLIEKIKNIVISNATNENNGINCLLGAGAAVDIGGPFTNNITRQIESINPLIAEISTELKQYDARLKSRHRLL